MRYLSEQIKIDLKRKMVFIGGPRQVGKTTLAKATQLVARLDHPYTAGRIDVVSPIDYFRHLDPGTG